MVDTWRGIFRDGYVLLEGERLLQGGGAFQKGFWLLVRGIFFFGGF